jgi:hypothetical protein
MVNIIATAAAAAAAAVMENSRRIREEEQRRYREALRREERRQEEERRREERRREEERHRERERKIIEQKRRAENIARNHHRISDTNNIGVTDTSITFLEKYYHQKDELLSAIVSSDGYENRCADGSSIFFGENYYVHKLTNGVQRIYEDRGGLVRLCREDMPDGRSRVYGAKDEHGTQFTDEDCFLLYECDASGNYKRYGERGKNGKWTRTDEVVEDGKINTSEILNDNQIFAYKEPEKAIKCDKVELMDMLKIKEKILRKKLRGKTGQTADSRIGEKTEEHKQTAKTHIDITKVIKKVGRGQNRK